MVEIFIIIVFILWYVFSLLVSENLGKKRKIGVEWSFFFCFVFSPIIGYLITASSPLINGNILNNTEI
ncbi:MAG: hypothetical protein KAT68_12245 [Bacteroidales bacterium]|nr:hypothetical protein [Bacteroidales bacterium]